MTDASPLPAAATWATKSSAPLLPATVLWSLLSAQLVLSCSNASSTSPNSSLSASSAVRSLFRG